MAKAKITISKTDFLAYLAHIGACASSLRFVKRCGGDAEEIYNRCERPDWLRFLFGRTGMVDNSFDLFWTVRTRVQRTKMIDGKFRENPAWYRAMCAGLRRRIPWSKIAAHLTT